MDAAAILAIVAKFVGAASGTVLALVFQPPKTVADFVTRSIFSLISGLVFSSPVRDYFHWVPSLETELAAGALVAMLSWWIMGAVVRIVGAWKPPK